MYGGELVNGWLCRTPEHDAGERCVSAPLMGGGGGWGGVNESARERVPHVTSHSRVKNAGTPRTAIFRRSLSFEIIITKKKITNTFFFSPIEKYFFRSCEQNCPGFNDSA